MPCKVSFEVNEREYEFEVWHRDTALYMIVAHYEHQGESFSIGTLDTDELPQSAQEALEMLEVLTWDNLQTFEDAGFQEL